jgi:S-formylglutathione hydrolase FrmB
MVMQICFLAGASVFGHAADTPTPPPAMTETPIITTEVSPEGCTIDTFSVHSPSMGREIKAVVVLPPGYKDHPEKSYPILYTLHGSGAPYDTFSKMIPLREALKDKPMIVTCFDGDSDSMYIDSPVPLKAGRDPKDTTPVKSLFTTFFLNEFIPAIDKQYRVNPAQRMLTGFSMGGFGAFHYMLVKPGEFASISSLSGWFGFDSANSLSPESKKWLEPQFGPYLENKEAYSVFNLFARIKKEVADGVKFPPVLLRCGTEDRLLEGNRDMHAFLDKQGIACEYKESPGKHDWPYWKGVSADVIDFHWRSLQKK